MSAVGDRRRIADISLSEFSSRLRHEGLGVRIGPFDVKLHSSVGAIERPLYRLYRDYSLLEAERVFSFHLSLDGVRSPRRLFDPQVRVTVDGRAPHEDLPAGQALAVLEWGLNLVIALRMHCLLMLHAGVVEKGGFVMVLPALPGAGKTTLCAALVARGWRLFSDEFGLVRPGSVDLIPLPRPMPLKNESIDVISQFSPDAELGPRIMKTRKGTIAHLKVPRSSIDASSLTAPAKWIVFPQWRAGAPLQIVRLEPINAFLRLATSSFNYEMLGESAFETVEGIVAGTACFALEYSVLEEAVAALEDIVESGGSRNS